MRRRARGCQCGQWNRPIRQTGLPAGERYRPRHHSKVHRLPRLAWVQAAGSRRVTGRTGAGLPASPRHPLFAPELGPPAQFCRLGGGSVPRSRGSCLSSLQPVGARHRFTSSACGAKAPAGGRVPARSELPLPLLLPTQGQGAAALAPITILRAPLPERAGRRFASWSWARGLTPSGTPARPAPGTPSTSPPCPLPAQPLRRHRVRRRNRARPG